MSVENIINNPPKEFTEPCEACGVSEFQLGVKHAEERIINLLESQIHGCSGYDCDSCDDSSQIVELIELIKDPNRNITSEILPDGTIYIEEINRENKHTHEIDVFGSPCDCGTRHEYCNNCDWVEPCGIEGETNEY